MNKKTFLALSTVVFATGIGFGIISPLIPVYAESMEASGLWLGIMFSSYAVSRLIFMPITGRLSDARDRKRFITLGLLAYTIISPLYAWAPNIIALTLVRFFHGLASSMVGPIAQAYIGDLTPKGKEGTYINLFAMSLFLGLAFGPLLSGVLTEYFSMAAAFYTMAAISGLALCLLLIFVPATEPRSRMESGGQAASVRTILRDSRVQAAGIFSISRSFWRQAIIVFLPLLAVSTMQMSIASIGLVLFAYLLIEAVVQGLVGPLIDRSNKAALVIICGTIGSALLFLIPYLHSGGILLALLVPAALLGAVARGTVLTIRVEAGKQHRGMGSVIGILGSATALGMMIGPIALGYTMDAFGLNSIFIVGAIIGIIGGLGSFYLLTK